MMKNNLTFKGIIFDDWTDNGEGYWTQICPQCKEKYHSLLGNRIDECGSGICGIKGCNNEAECYVDFYKKEIELTE